MYVVASLLDPTAALQTRQVWNNLHSNCGLAGIQLTPLPHFTWHAAMEYADDTLEHALRKIVQKLKPFRVSSSGMGIFTGESPVLYAMLVKTRAFLDAHEFIWSELEGVGIEVNKHYHPNNWVPHVTLAYRDVTHDNLPCALADLAFQSFVMDAVVDHLAVLYDVDGKIGIKARYEFQAK